MNKLLLLMQHPSDHSVMDVYPVVAVVGQKGNSVDVVKNVFTGSLGVHSDAEFQRLLKSNKVNEMEVLTHE